MFYEIKPNDEPFWSETVVVSVGFRLIRVGQFGDNHKVKLGKKRSKTNGVSSAVLGDTQLDWATSALSGQVLVLFQIAFCPCPDD